MASSSKKIVKYEITKTNGKVIFRDASEWNADDKKRYEAKGYSVKEIKE